MAEAGLQQDRIQGPARTRFLIAIMAFFAATAVPMSFFYYMLPASLSQAGYGADVVGLITLVYLPYALRVIWAPLVDRMGNGGARRYRLIALATLALAVLSMLSMGVFSLATDLVIIAALAFGVFFFLSTGMTAIDGYCLMMLGPKGRQTITAYSLGGLSVGGVLLGLASFWFGSLPWDNLVAIIVGGTFVLALPTLLLPALSLADVGSEQQEPDADKSRLWSFMKRATTRRRMIISVFAHGGLGLPMGYFPVLQVNAGLSLNEIGLYGSVGGNVSGILSAILMGSLMAAVGAWRGISTACLFGIGCFLLLAFWPLLAAYAGMQDVAGASHSLGPVQVVAAYLLLNFLGFSVLVPYRALVLQICDGQRPASQAAALSSFDMVITILCSSLSGLVVVWAGVTNLFLVSAAFCLIGLLLSYRFFRIETPIKKTPDQDIVNPAGPQEVVL